MSCQELNSKVQAIADYFNITGNRIRTNAQNIRNKISAEGNLAEAKQLLAAAQAGLSELQRKENELSNLSDELAIANCSQVFVGTILGVARDTIIATQNGIANGQKAINDYERAVEKEKEEFEKNASKPQDPEPDSTVEKQGENQADDDSSSKQEPGQNQKPDVVPTPGQTTTQGNTGTAEGVSASPGPSGSSGVAEMPGKRLFNPLSKLSSYTYNITLYMITPDSYDKFLQSGRRKLDIGQGNSGVFIVAQSGGINKKTYNRAPGFELDYYIDNLKFTTTTNPKASGTSSYTTDISFTITEPYGFSFIQNLRKANDALKEYTSQTSYKDCIEAFKNFFVIGLRFYGYDINGNVITGQEPLYQEPLDPTGNGEALFEHYYDIILDGVKFNLNGKAVQYNCTASGVSGLALLGTKRGRIPTGVTVEGSTIHDALVGPNGLFTKLNKQEQEKINRNPPDQQFANEYDVVYLGDAFERLGIQSMVTQADLDKWRWPGADVKNTTESTDAAGKAPPDNDKRTLTFNNDTSIIQAITQIIQKSQFMEIALKTMYTNSKQPDPKQKNSEQVKNEIPTKLAWFNISTELTNPKWDTKINDWVYKTLYIIQIYEVPSLETPYGKNGAKYYGPHKRYDYWFTGQNNEIIDFNLTFNNLYHNIALGLIEGTGNPAGEASVNGQVSVTTGMKQGGDSTGSLNIGAEAQNSVTTYLFDPAAWAEAKLKILGDPDYLMNETTSSLSELYNRFYGSDNFTISAQGGQVFIEVDFKESQDYKNSTGLQSINESIAFYPYPEYVKKIAKGVVFMVTTVTSTFNNGRFEQTLETLAPSFPPDPNESQSDTGNTREAQNDQSAGNTNNSGASSGNTGATSGNTGQKQDPPVVPERPNGPGLSAPSNDTVGVQSPQTVSTQTGPVADDDALQEITVTGTRKNVSAEEGREAIIDTFTPQVNTPVDITVPVPRVNGRG
jgi:hypothetical protein